MAYPAAPLYVIWSNAQGSTIKLRALSYCIHKVEFKAQCSCSKKNPGEVVDTQVLPKLLFVLSPACKRQSPIFEPAPQGWEQKTLAIMPGHRWEQKALAIVPGHKLSSNVK